MIATTITLHDYAAAQVGKGPLREISLSQIAVTHTPDLHMLEWAGTGFTILARPDRLRQLAAIILDKFPLVAPPPGTVQPVEDRLPAHVDPYDHPSLIFTPLNNSEVAL